MANRLAESTSPYLLQHKDNPVDWREWGDAAFAEARRRACPILLSVGYAACHWCHVMAHESFEDAATAEAMNSAFVCVKVDREERPDVDAVYMQATQAMTGSGGWPMTVFMTPGGDPFFCGTYFPPAPRPGLPSFRQLVDAVAGAWQDRREELTASGARIVERLMDFAAVPPLQIVTPQTLAAGAAALVADHDDARGGFGGAPKFPPSMALEFLLRHAARANDDGAERVVTRTCEAMARGGIYDQLGGGFARYSVDSAWVVPHFEKMLYDNALLARVYAHLWRQTGSGLARRVAVETAEFVVRDLDTDGGGFASSLDADTNGVEGATYVWTPSQLADVLGPEDAAWAAGLLRVTADGTFEGGASTLQLPADPDDAQRWKSLRSRLFRARLQRPQPGRDDKIVTAWNGLAIAALADTGTLLDHPSFVDSAVRAAELLLRVHLVDGRLRRASRAGVAGSAAGVLEDYADLAEGLLALHQATSDGRWLRAAGALLDTAIDRFADSDGAFWDTADDAERLVARPRDLTDGPVPAAAPALAGAMLTYAALTGVTHYRDRAAETVGTLAALIGRAPRAAGWAAAIGEALLAGPAEVAVVAGTPQAARGLADVARAHSFGGAVVVAGVPDQSGVPLLAGRPLLGGRPTAYVCRGFVCDAPVTDADALRAALDG
ncbi:MAG: N-acylglucosamine 2-epimerase [Pseudonocardiales bacterium]|nr:MAG: N-acylglucosamine 2-epimerase [Pseudonocardiales bacterium]